MKPDVEIAHEAHMEPIENIAARLGIERDELEFYGKYKAKLTDQLRKRIEGRPNGHLVLVTAINPTPAGEGKTTTTIGLGQAMSHIGANAVIALREPSLGPVFGVKGGAAGGGYSQVVPMEDINLHFTGDFHAITSANNLLAAMIDNHIQQGNELNIDVRRIVFKRVMDMNDRALRNVVVGLGAPSDGVPRQDGFMITVASEIMAILCLSESLSEMKQRLGDILVAYDLNGEPVYARDLKADGAMTALMKDAIKPNLVQTLENTPCIMHGGPFANIAHGCNSVIATRTALKLADYCITEAGFGADLGAEKFFDIKCRKTGLCPDGVVLVATVRSLKYNGGVAVGDLGHENLEALDRGLENLGAHIENLKGFGMPPVVALNRFPSDTAAELEAVRRYCAGLGTKAIVSTAFTDGGAGATELAGEVVRMCNEKKHLRLTYDDSMSIREKIEAVCKRIYRAAGADFTPAALNAIEAAERDGRGSYPVCIAKTQYSLSDDPKKLGRPSGHRITIREVRVCTGAGFVVALAGNIMTMPGLLRHPAAERIDVDAEGVIHGLF